MKSCCLAGVPCPNCPADLRQPETAVAYWRAVVEQADYFNPEVECFVVLRLNTRRRVNGHHLVSIGTLDTILVHPREVFRTTIIAALNAVVLMRNHPSGNPVRSEADIKVTRDLIRAGQLMKMEVLIVGSPSQSSLRAFGLLP